jgi:microcystin-dependent protein
MYDPFDGSSKLLSTISSANFNGAIPDLIVQYPDATTDDLIPGRFFLITDTYYLITRVDENIDPTTTDTISYNVWYTSGGVERYKTILAGVKIFTDGTELQIRKDDWTNKSIGSSGWTITTEGNSVFSNVAVRGTIEATDGYFDGHLYIGDPDDPDSPGGMRIGTNVDGTRENPGTQDGIYINTNNYWYDSGLFKIGNSSKNVVWDNTNLAVTGDINATGGVFAGKVQIGSMYLGVDASPTSENGIYIDGTNYWYDDGNFSLGTGTNTISFNGSNIVVGTGVNIAGEISANSLLLTSGSFSMSIKSNHNPVSSSIRTITKVVLSGTSPQLAEFTTSSSHPFISGDFIYVSGLSDSGGGLGSVNKVFQVSSVTSNTINVNASSSTKVVTVNADNTDTTLSVISSTGVYAGMSVSGTGIQSGTTVVSTTPTVITISNATTQALSDVSITFSPINGTYDLNDSGWSNGQVEYSYDGIYVNQHNYWYSNGLFAIGDGTKGLTWNGSALNVTGVINASEGGSMAGWSIGSDEIYKGTGSSKIALNAGTTPKIYIGSGTHATAGTGFYVDSDGKFSLSNLLTFSPSVDTPEVSTTGTFNSGTDTITVASASGIVKGMTVIGTGIASNSTVTNISGTTITTSKNATANGTGVSLTFILDDFSELQVNGRIKGVLESTSSIVTPRLATTATSIVVSGTAGNQIATITTTGHAFIAGEKILIENLPSTDGLDKLNREFPISLITDSITLVISLSGIVGVTNSTNTGLNGSVTLRELTMGLHPTEGFIGTAPNYTDRSSWYHTDGTGIRLDKFNWWFTNNYFRVGSVDSYVKWNGTSLDVTGIINAQSGTFTGNVDIGTGDSKVRIGPTVRSDEDSGIFYNPFNYWLRLPDGSVNFHLGDEIDGLDYYNGQIVITGTVLATSGRFGGSTGWDITEAGVLSSGVGASYLALASTDAEISETANQTFTISQIIIDDEAYDNYDSEFPNDFVDYSTFYIKIPISQSAFNRVANCPSMTLNQGVITVDSTVGLFPGMGVSGTGIAVNTTISSVDGKDVYLSNVVTSTGTNRTITFTPNIESAINMFENKYVYFPSGFTSTLSVLNGKKFLVQNVLNEEYAIVDGDETDSNTMYDYADVSIAESSTYITIQIYGEEAYSITTNSKEPIKVYTSLTIDNSDPDFPNELVNVVGSIQGTYTSGISTASYVPKLTQGSVTYMLWAGDESATSSKLSISKNNSTDLITIKADAGTVPIGSVTMWITGTLPAGWLECNGQTITQDAYPELYDIIGANVPDMRGRFPLGYGGTTSPTGAAIAATTKLTGGAIRYTYAATAAHTHTPGTFSATTSITEGTAVSSNHGHAVSGSVGDSNSNGSRSYSPNLTNILTATSAHTHADNFVVNDSSTAGSHTHNMNAFTASTSITEPANTGGTTAANATIDVYPPYYSVSFIIYSGRA